jgi:hypothetical protein
MSVASRSLFRLGCVLVTSGIALAVVEDLAWQRTHARGAGYSSPAEQRILTSIDLAVFSAAVLVALIGGLLLSKHGSAVTPGSRVFRALGIICRVGIVLAVVFVACGLYGIIEACMPTAPSPR